MTPDARASSQASKASLGRMDRAARMLHDGASSPSGAAAHFRDRDRTTEFGALVMKHPQWLGLGIDADTALVVRGAIAEALGKGAVTVFDYRTGAPSEPVLLKSGARFDLVTGKSLD